MRIGTLDAVFDVLDSNLVCILCQEVIDFLLQPASRHRLLVCRIRLRGLGKDLNLCHNANNDSPVHREVQIKQLVRHCMHNIVTSREKFIFLKNFFHENLSYFKKMAGLPASKSK